MIYQKEFVMGNKILAFLKKEIVFVISFILASASCFFVTPSEAYLGYIDLNVLYLLFAFMAVVAGLRDCGVFDKCADFMCRLAGTVRALGCALVFMCFVFGMFITNDVALLTFVPFTIMLLTKCAQLKYSVYIVVLQTIAANLGSMLTPMGNPQNLFLYSKMGISAIDFCKILLPYTIVSAAALAVCCLFIPNKKLFEDDNARELFFKRTSETENKSGLKTFRTIVYSALFIVCILSVLKIIPAWILVLAVGIIILAIQAKILLKVDYILLLTFVCFFIFSGNIQNIEFVKNQLQAAVAGREFLCGILASQVISNVPATLLLYPFAVDAKELLIGVDLGGLGTLIASLASLISYKLYANTEGAEGGKFIKVFTLMNLIFIAVLVCSKLIFCRL